MAEERDSDRPMINSEQFIIEQFHESIAAKMAACEAISEDLADVADALTDTLLHQGKVLTLGNGESGIIAKQLSLALTHRLERERPALPSLCLNHDALTLGSMVSDGTPEQIYARQIRGLGEQKDALVIILQEEATQDIIQAVRAAHDRQMLVVLIAGPTLGSLNEQLGEHDIDVLVPVEPSPRLTEIHLLSVSCIVELIEAQLFGVDS